MSNHENDAVRRDLGKAARAFDIESYLAHIHALGYAHPDDVPATCKAALLSLNPAKQVTFSKQETSWSRLG